MYRIPLPIMVVTSFFMLLYSRFTGNEPLITPDYVRKFSYDWKVSCEKARIELGYNPLTLKQGLTKTIEWINRGYKNDIYE